MSNPSPRRDGGPFLQDLGSNLVATGSVASDSLHMDVLHDGTVRQLGPPVPLIGIGVNAGALIGALHGALSSEAGLDGPGRHPDSQPVELGFAGDTERTGRAVRHPPEGGLARIPSKSALA